LCDVLGLLIPFCRRCPLRFSLFVTLFVTFCLADLLSYLACVCVCVYTQHTYTMCICVYIERENIWWSDNGQLYARDVLPECRPVRYTANLRFRV
jgi:hypothetical protein